MAFAAYSLKMQSSVATGGVVLYVFWASAMGALCR